MARSTAGNHNGTHLRHAYVLRYGIRLRRSGFAQAGCGGGSGRAGMWKISKMYVHAEFVEHDESILNGYRTDTIYEK
jgi:hypothetical protein